MKFRNSTRFIVGQMLLSMVQMILTLWFITKLNIVGKLFMIPVLPVAMFYGLDALLYRFSVSEGYVEEFRFFNKKRLNVDQIGIVYKVHDKRNKPFMIVERIGPGNNYFEVELDRVVDGEKLFDSVSKLCKNDERSGPLKITVQRGFMNINHERMKDLGHEMFIFTLFAGMVLDFVYGFGSIIFGR